MQLNNLNSPKPMRRGRSTRRNWRAIISLENLKKVDVDVLVELIAAFCQASGGAMGGGFAPDYKNWNEAVADTREEFKWALAGRASGEPYQKQVKR
jgi:hypothetical protein